MGWFDGKAGGLLGNFGGNNQGMGILGGQNIQPSGMDIASLISATLSDGYAGYRGKQGTAVDSAVQGMQSHGVRQQLMAGLQSPDPAIRQKAYMFANMNGIPTDGFQKQQAQSQLPAFLASMKPQQATLNSQSAPLPGGGNITSAPINFEAPGKNISEAIQSAPPEIQGMYAPELIKQQMTAQADAAKPVTLSPGQVRFGGDGQQIAGLPEKATPNSPFNPDGTPNKAFQQYEQGKIKTQQAPQWASIDLARQKLSSGIPDEATLHDMATRYVNGDKGVATGMSRNPQMQSAFQGMISQVGRERGLSQSQISQNQQTFSAGTRAVQAFDTGKQGDTTRSLNVSVAHLNTLKDLGTALNNGDITLINAAKQKFAEAFGVPAPTNFDAARAIVADEVAKGVIGGQTAQADREALAASLKRERSPQAINGAIGTFQNLLAGQLHGLRQQYQSSTGRQDFNDKLFPETISVLEGSHQKPKLEPSSAANLPRLPSAPKVRTFNPATGRLE